MERLVKMQIKLLQSELWAKLKGKFGWNSFIVTLDANDIRVFIRPLPFGFHFAYIPYGFEHVIDLQPVKKELIRSIRENVKKLLFIRLDLSDYFAFPSEEGINFSKTFRIPSWLKKSSDVQPPDTVVLNLIETTEEELLANMHKKTRYNIKLAQKKEVQIEKSNINRLPEWYQLYEATAKRDKISIHKYEYYKTLFELAQEDSAFNIKLFLASHEDDLLAGIVVLEYEGQAIYLYGASSNEKRNLMPAYLLQWEAIKESLSNGCHSYDFYGIPPVNNPKHPMYGLYRFKTGFGGEIVHRAGAWDLPTSLFYYRLFRILEKLRLFYYKKVKKRGSV